MTVYDEMAKALEQFPLARERKNKHRIIAYILQKKHLELGFIERKRIAEILEDAVTYDRAWRKVTEERPELRGTDYKEKARLVKAKQKELGYPV